MAKLTATTEIIHRVCMGEILCVHETLCMGECTHEFEPTGEAIRGRKMVVQIVLKYEYILNLRLNTDATKLFLFKVDIRINWGFTQFLNMPLSNRGQ